MQRLMINENTNSIKTKEYDSARSMSKNDQLYIENAGYLLEIAHQKGDRRASYALATWYLHGNGKYKKDKSKAIYFLKIAADAGIPCANYDIAVCYEIGDGVKKNTRVAYKHYLSAALGGDYDAVEEVARCLHYGIGVMKDRSIAQVWYLHYERIKECKNRDMMVCCLNSPTPSS